MRLGGPQIWSGRQGENSSTGTPTRPHRSQSSRSYFTTDSQSVSQYVFVSSTLVGLATRYYFLSECCCLKFAVLFQWGALSDEDGSVICSVTTQWPESLRTRNHTLLSHLRFPQAGGAGSRIYISQEQGGPVTPPGTGSVVSRCTH
jgi:hypothetical protein